MEQVGNMWEKFRYTYFIEHNYSDMGLSVLILYYVIFLLNKFCNILIASYIF